MSTTSMKTVSVVAALLIALACGVAVWKLHAKQAAAGSVSQGPVNITTGGNYGIFLGLDNEDNDYFSTHDQNVRNIIATYLDQQPGYPYKLTEAERFGTSLIYYYDKNVFVVAGLTDWRNKNSVSGFGIHSMATGKWTGDCFMYAAAGLYQSNDLLLSATFVNSGSEVKQGICYYDRGAKDFTFVDLTDKLGKNETLFDDPAGRNLHASVHDVDAKGRTLVVDVYDASKLTAKGNYSYKRSMKVFAKTDSTGSY